MSRALLIATVVASLLGACRRTSDATNGVSSETNDGGSQQPPADARSCPALPPADGGIVWSQGVTASVSSAQAIAWSRVSNADECSALVPGTMADELSWTGPANGICDPAVISGAGDLAVFSLQPDSLGVNFVSGDGARAQYALWVKSEDMIAVGIRMSGFAVVRHVFTNRCDYGAVMDTIEPPASFTLIDGPPSTQIYKLVPNPRGGYVQVRVGGVPDVHLNLLELRWVDENLLPQGEWQSAMTWPAFTENQWSVSVDQQGRAFVLSFVFPPTLGSPPAPSSWTFAARWLDAQGPVGDVFQPIVPTYTAPDGRVYFANWDVLVPMQQGGFAVFHWPNSGPGSLSNAGWYAFYPSGSSEAIAPQAWLTAYDGSLQLVGDGHAYAALQRNETTCARKVSLIAPSGVTCYEVSLPDSDVCGAKDRIQPDGTIALQNGCALRWWPQVALPAP